MIIAMCEKKRGEWLMTFFFFGLQLKLGWHFFRHQNPESTTDKGCFCSYIAAA